jgi:hypothetical protein
MDLADCLDRRRNGTDRCDLYPEQRKAFLKSRIEATAIATCRLHESQELIAIDARSREDRLDILCAQGVTCNLGEHSAIVAG